MFPPSSPPAHRGHGRRLVDAIQALDAFPAFVESRDALLESLAARQPHHGRAVAAIESDIALTVAVMRQAADAVRNAPGVRRPQSIVQAVELLSDASLLQLARTIPTFDVFERATMWGAEPDRLRLHSEATQAAACRLADTIGLSSLQRDRLLVTSLLHDVGRLVLARAYPDRGGHSREPNLTPEQRVHAERTEFGVDHAMVGGVLARRWGLPASISHAIEHHHHVDRDDAPPYVALADMVVHYQAGDPVDPRTLVSAATAVGLDRDGLRGLLRLPGVAGPARRGTDPCPLSHRELGVLRELASGKVYQQIADTLGLSRSTIRSHLHNIYGKIGAADRAQAVLLATDHGWL